MSQHIKYNFYETLNSYSSYEELNQCNDFAKVPADWSIAFTDVRGSTKAIENGMYKEINTVGVSAIIAIKNACDDIPLPFVFGGDGSTVLFPNQYTAKVKQILQELDTHSRVVFGLDLRCAIVPVEDVNQQGHKILVGKIKLSEKNNLAVFIGGGLSYAEQIVKGPQSEKYIIKSDNSTKSPNLKGLECRWNPLLPKNEMFMSLIISPNQNAENIQNLFLNLTSEINKIVPINYLVKPDNLDLTWPPKHISVEVKCKHKNSFVQKSVLLTLNSLTWIFIKLIKKYKDKTGTGINEYVKGIVTNTDHYKIDDGIKMILDINSNQKEKILAVLEKFKTSGLIFFGYHTSNTALMTCFVRSLSEHIHFVDGGEGGYAMAAKMLKSQKNMNMTNN